MMLMLMMMMMMMMILYTSLVACPFSLRVSVCHLPHETSSLLPKWMRFPNYIYNITKAKRALWLVNLASICPWVYAADVCANVYKANLLTDIVSKLMADILLPEMGNCLHSCLKMKLYWVTGVQSVVINEFSRACFLLSCKTTGTFFCDVPQ